MWVYTPGPTAIRRICDVAFNIAIPSQRQRTSLLTIASENFRRKDHRSSQAVTAVHIILTF